MNRKPRLPLIFATVSSNKGYRERSLACSSNQLAVLESNLHSVCGRVTAVGVCQCLSRHILLRQSPRQVSNLHPPAPHAGALPIAPLEESSSLRPILAPTDPSRPFTPFSQSERPAGVEPAFPPWQSGAWAARPRARLAEGEGVEPSRLIVRPVSSGVPSPIGLPFRLPSLHLHKRRLEAVVTIISSCICQVAKEPGGSGCLRFPLIVDVGKTSTPKVRFAATSVFSTRSVLNSQGQP
jgi:hypothetical protein